MAAPRTTTPTQLPTVVLETAPSTPPPAPTPKRYDTVDRPRVVLTTSPEVRKLQTLFRSACHDSPRLVPGARAGARARRPSRASRRGRRGRAASRRRAAARGGGAAVAAAPKAFEPALRATITTAVAPALDAASDVAAVVAARSPGLDDPRLLIHRGS